MIEADIPIVLESHLLEAPCVPDIVIWENWQECDRVPVNQPYFFVRWLPSQPNNRGFGNIIYQGAIDIVIVHPLNGKGARAVDLDAECVICHFGAYEHYSYTNPQTNTDTRLWTEIPYRLPAQPNNNRYQVTVRVPYKACGSACS